MVSYVIWMEKGKKRYLCVISVVQRMTEGDGEESGKNMVLGWCGGELGRSEEGGQTACIEKYRIINCRSVLIVLLSF